MSFQRWPVNSPVLDGNAPTPVWQRWLSALVAQLTNGVFQTLRATGALANAATLTVGDSTGFTWSSTDPFMVVSGGTGSDVALILGPDPSAHLLLEGYSGGGVIGTADHATPIYLEASALYLNSDVGGPVGIGLDTATAHLHIKAGSATAGTAPIKLTAGTLLTTPEVGALEYVDAGVTGHLYFTRNVAGVPTRGEVTIV